ncbi:MAG: hypothetical protein JWR54_2741, partial [Mucilaginibacter sp.]|nr:hypothetical protein [Mucilaginibacter sp.]
MIKISRKAIYILMLSGCIAAGNKTFAQQDNIN